MNIYVTNEHFYETWFCFTQGEEKENLLALKNKISASIYAELNKITNEVEYVAIKPEEFNLLCYPYSWCEKPIIRFSTRGINLSDEKLEKGNSSFCCNSTQYYLNAEIQLNELNENIIRCANLSIEDLIKYAKYRWCEDMELDYLFIDEALYIEERIQLGKSKADTLFNNGEFTNEFYDLK